MNDIKGIPVEELDKIKYKDEMHESVNSILDKEFELFKEKNNDTSKEQLTGLAISGGGIRSASFALGIMQSLAAENLMKKFDYLSTVSGGGYIGGALSWWLNSEERWSDKNNQKRPSFGLGKDNFPYGCDDPADPEQNQDSEDQQKLLTYLQHHGNYLAPGKGINIVSLIAVIIRGMALNLLVWVPLVVLLFALLIEPPLLDSQGPYVDELPLFAFYSLISSLILSALFILACILYSLGTYGFGLNLDGNLRYRFRRSFEAWAAKYLGVIIVFAVLGSIPFFYIKIANLIHEVGIGAMLLGIVSGIITYNGSNKKSIIPKNLIATLGAILFIYGLLTLCYALAFELSVKDALTSCNLYTAILVGFTTVAILTGIFVNLNYLSIHRYYRDRLMETFNPDWKTVKNNGTGPATEANNGHYTKFNQQRPYHIVNTNVVLVDSSVKRIKLRGGDNFILSPLYCGSNATGWRDSKEFLKGKMTLATAVAISGAAANPNTGVGGVGLTRNNAVSLLMALLNLRLGYWVPNPKEPNQRLKFNHFRSGWKELFPGIGYQEDQNVIQLSDGGHFENLALYELIRRRLRLIIVCDGGADPAFAFTDLQNAISRVDEDFGTKIRFDYKDNNLTEMIPDHPAGYPKEAEKANKGFIVGEIIYPNEMRGTIILLKTTFIDGLNLNVEGYKGANPDFPDQSTADQFFSKEQLEAYRQLGYAIGHSMIEKLNYHLKDSQPNQYKDMPGLSDFFNE